MAFQEKSKKSDLGFRNVEDAWNEEATVKTACARCNFYLSLQIHSPSLSFVSQKAGHVDCLRLSAASGWVRSEAGTTGSLEFWKQMRQDLFLQVAVNWLPLYVRPALPQQPPFPMAVSSPSRRRALRIPSVTSPTGTALFPNSALSLY